jgi:hypothetical protein
MHYVHEQVWPSLRNKKLARAHTFSIALCVPSLIPVLYAGGDVEKIENPLQLVTDEVHRSLGKQGLIEKETKKLPLERPRGCGCSRGLERHFPGASAVSSVAIFVTDIVGQA